MAIVEMVGPLTKCNCGCGLTYLNNKEWQQHYLKDVLPKSLKRWINSSDSIPDLMSPDDPRNHQIV